LGRRRGNYSFKLRHWLQKDMGKILERSRMPTLLAICSLLVVCFVTACGESLGEHLQSGRVFALLGLEGRWVGPVVPVDRNCGPTTQGLMSIGKSGFGFDPFQSTAIVHGEVDADGRLSGSLVRHGAEHQDLSLGFEAASGGADEIVGTLQSGRCRWKVTLHRG
jgi:hypothetical protein